MRRRSWIAGVALIGTLAAGAAVNRAAVRATLAMDDFAQRAMIEGALTPRRGPFNLYDLIADDNRAALLDRGVIPWWSEPNLTIRFLRPLPSLLVWLDYRIFGNDSLGPHVLSFLWWAAAVLAAFMLYRVTVGKRAARIAALVFALSPTLAVPLVWLANRSTLVSVTFSALALTLYVRWRNDRRWGLGLGTAVAFGAAALTGEYSLCLIGYLISYELCRRGDDVRRRLVGALPAVGPLLLYVAVHAALGYGTAGTGFYRDPTTALGTYLRALPETISALLISSWLGPGGTVTLQRSEVLRAMLMMGAGLWVARTLWIARRRQSGVFPAGVSWLACGSVMALFPLAATEPALRVLGIAALGVSAVVGALVEEGVRRVSQGLRPSLLLGLAVLATFIHLIVAPLQTRRISVENVDDQNQSLARFTTVPRRARSVDTVLVVRATQGLTALSAPFVLREDAPRHWLVLSHTFQQTAAIRTSPSSLDVVQEKTPLFPIGWNGIVRTSPFAVGDVVETAALRATVLKIDDAGRPLSVHYEFNRNLDHSDVAWISEDRSGFSEVIPPPVGIGVRLAR